MSLIRRTRALLLPAVVLGAGGGCQFMHYEKPTERVNDAPIVIDEAMQTRDWDRSVAYYQNGAVVAGPTGIWAHADQDLPEFLQGIFETPIFIGQVFSSPVTAVIDPPWKDVVYPGLRLEPSFTAVPPTNANY